MNWPTLAPNERLGTFSFLFTYRKNLQFGNLKIFFFCPPVFLGRKRKWMGWDLLFHLARLSQGKVGLADHCNPSFACWWGDLWVAVQGVQELLTNLIHTGCSRIFTNLIYTGYARIVYKPNSYRMFKNCLQTLFIRGVQELFTILTLIQDVQKLFTNLIHTGCKNC